MTIEDKEVSLEVRVKLNQAVYEARSFSDPQTVHEVVSRIEEVIKWLRGLSRY